MGENFLADIPMTQHGSIQFHVPQISAGTDKKYPILMMRTCYSVSPYGEDRYRADLGPNRALQDDGYIFVYQDVRGCYMSEGAFRNMTPHVPKVARQIPSPESLLESFA